MAMPPTKLGRVVDRALRSNRDPIRMLRAKGLVRPDAPDDDLYAILWTAEKEQRARSQHHEMILGGQREEHVRVLLAPYLTPKGQRWADPHPTGPWWKFWV